METPPLSFVVQGPIVAEKAGNFSTREVLRSIRKHFPWAELILSTWKGAVLSDLDFDILVLSDDPGGFTHKDSMINCNRMLLSTKAGIEKANHQLIVKTRTDILFENNALLTQLKAITLIKSKYGLFERFVLSTIFYVRDPIKLNLLFHASDIFLIGTRSSLLTYFSAPQAERKMFVNPDEETRVTPEQYLMLYAIQRVKGVIYDVKYWSYVNIRYFFDSEKYIFNNFKFFSPESFGIRFQQRLYSVFKPECNYTLEQAKKLQRAHANALLRLPLSAWRGVKYFKANYIPYYKKNGWKRFPQLLLRQLKLKDIG
jgi:hypothetical protein